MVILVVDNDRYSLLSSVKCLNNVYPESDILSFTDSVTALEYGISHEINAVFTEIPMNGLDGISLTKRLKKVNRNLSVSFVSVTDEYAFDAYRLRADGYYLKPITVEKLMEQIEQSG